MKKSLAWLVILLTVFAMFSTPAVAMSGIEPITETSLEPAASFEPNGEYIISILKDGKWDTIAALTFDRFMRERQLDISPFLKNSGNINIRIAQKSGGSAYLDSAFLGGAAPVKTNSYDTAALMKLSATDDDIIKVDTEGIALEFAYPEKGSTLRIRARIENEIISKIPYQFPLDNLDRQINDKASFYSYQLGSTQQTAQLDGVLSETLSKEPIFKEFISPGSGHPAGFVYGWVMNDDENLYILMDVTPDNTFDGDKDYAKVYIKTIQGIKEFKLSVPETTWGRPEFTYTDNVVYQHKIYEFKIPFSEIVVNKMSSQSEIDLCFEVYGTLSYVRGYEEPALAYGSRDNRYLCVFMADIRSEYGMDIYGQFVDAAGDPVILNPDNYEPFDSIFPICNYADNQRSPAVAYDSINNQFLVVWSDYNWEFTGYERIYGQLINSDGTFSGSEFLIDDSDEGDKTQISPKVSFDSQNGRFLITWLENWYGGDHTGINGRFLYPNGEFSGNTFAVSTAFSYKHDPAICYDTNNGNFLIAWSDTRDGSDYHIYGHIVNGASPFDLQGNITGNDFIICDERQRQTYTAIAHNSSIHMFIVTWNDEIYGDYIKCDSYGQIVSPTGELEGNEFVVAGNAIENDNLCQYGGEIAYDSINQRLLLIYSETPTLENDYYLVKGKFINTSNSDIGEVFTISNEDFWGEYPSLAYNTINNNFLVAYVEKNPEVYNYRVAYGNNWLVYKVIGEAYNPPSPYLTGIRFEPDTYSLVTGGTKQTVVKAVYSDNSVRHQITEGLSFSSDDNTKVSIDNNTGAITGVAVGNRVNIRAQYSAHSVLNVPTIMAASALVTVTDPNVTPAPTPTPVPLPTAPPRVPVGEIIVDGVILQSIYEDDIDKNKELFSFIEYKDGQSAKLWLKGDFYNRLLSGKKDPALEFKWDGITYTLPLKCVDVTAAANELAINPFSTRFNLVIDKVKDEDAEAAKKAAKELGAQIIGGLTSFKVEISGEYSNAKKQIDNYNCYVTRTVNISSGPLININNTSGMKFLTDTGKFTFAPSIFGVYNGSRAITIKYRGNGSYAILKYPVSFNDISGHWGLSYIEKLASRLIASAEKGDAYAPDEKISRGEFAAMLAKAMGITEESGNKAFEDIKDQWYAKDVIAIANANIISGRNDEKFYPEDYILREEMAAMVYRALEFAAIPVNEYELESVLSMFKDRSKISSYAVKEAAVCAKTGIIIGRANGDFAPSENATRAEAAAVIERMLKFLEFINE